VNIGPHRDILGDWRKAAEKEGLRFGIAFHGDYSLWWYQPAFLADLAGPLKGVPYDGAQNYEGKETWWQKMGLNLKGLYGIDLKDDVAFPANFTGDPNEFRMRDPLSQGIPNGDLSVHRDFAVWYATEWTRRVIDAIDQFSPDFIYFDGGNSYPFCGYGTGRGLRADATPRVIAHLYNQSILQNGGKLEAIAFTKGPTIPVLRPSTSSRPFQKASSAISRGKLRSVWANGFTPRGRFMKAAWSFTRCWKPFRAMATTPSTFRSHPRANSIPVA